MDLRNYLQGLNGKRNRSREAQVLLVHNRLLGERLYWYSLARYLVVAAIVVGAVFAERVVGVEGLDVPALMVLGIVLAAYNTVVLLIVRPLRDRERAGASYVLLASVMHATILLDFMVLTVALWLVGGARSPFLAFYLFHVILASLLLSRYAAFAYTVFGYLLLAGLVIGEWHGWIPSRIPAGAVSGSGPLDVRYVVTLLVVYGLLFALSASMLTSLVQLLRAGERDLRTANKQLASVSALRRDFLQMVLHDLKTPMVAVAQHLYNLDAQLRGTLSEQELHWVTRCQLRLKEMADFLNDLQVLTLLESDAVQGQAQPVDLKALLTKLTEQNQDLAHLRQHTLTLDAPESLPTLHGIERLLQEAVANLISNAVKYTPPGGTIILRARTEADPQDGPTVRIEVQDTGIGISAEDQPKLFQEFGRVRHQPNANVDTRGSSGLGLAIVRRVAELHGGTVQIHSEPNRGSTFSILLPVREGEQGGHA